jgi:hypothetical protein
MPREASLQQSGHIFRKVIVDSARNVVVVAPHQVGGGSIAGCILESVRRRRVEESIKLIRGRIDPSFDLVG